MLIQIKNRILLLDAISYAAIEFPDENSQNDWIELLLIVDGQTVLLYSDEALLVWQTIQRNACNLGNREPIYSETAPDAWGMPS